MRLGAEKIVDIDVIPTGKILIAVTTISLSCTASS